MVLRSASLWSKLDEATTMTSPAAQSIASITVNIRLPALIDVDNRVHVVGRGVPCMENAHSMQPIPLFPNIGCCDPS